MTRSQIQSKAITDFENILKQAGWNDGYGLSPEQIKTSSTALFWRNHTPLDGMAKNVWLRYQFIDDITEGADNKAYYGEIYIGISIFYNDQYYFNESKNLLADMENLLEFNLWGIDWGEEISYQAEELAGRAINQKNLTINKTY